jgi:hypothetical protein
MCRWDSPSGKGIARTAVDGSKVEQRPVKLSNATYAEKIHRSRDIVTKPLKDAVDAPLASGPEPVEIGTTRHTGRGSCCDGLDDVTSTTHAAVADDFDLPAYGIRNGCNQRKCCGRSVELATAMVR